MSVNQPMLHLRIEELLLEKLRQRRDEFAKLRYWGAREIENIWVRRTRNFEKIEEALSSDGWQEIRVGDKWAEDGEFGWFRMNFSVPEDLAGKPLVAILRFGTTGWLGGEGCLFIEGVPYQGVDANHPEVILRDEAKAGENIELVVECVSTTVWQNIRHEVKLEQAHIAALNPDVRDYWHDLAFIVGVAESLPPGSRRRATIIRTANESVDAFDPYADEFETLAKSARKSAQIIAPLYEVPAEASALEFACAGHSHTDVAWLWPYAETIRKCSRTFSTVNRLMDEYPDYLFTQSQAQLFEFTKQHYP